MTVELLTVHEAADALRLPVSTLYHLNAEGRGPQGMKLGRRLMYRREALEAFVTAQERLAAAVGA